jgi:hypothetical protein
MSIFKMPEGLEGVYGRAIRGALALRDSLLHRTQNLAPLSHNIKDV